MKLPQRGEQQLAPRRACQVVPYGRIDGNQLANASTIRGNDALEKAAEFVEARELVWQYVPRKHLYEHISHTF